jgi:hypothetical protein
MGYGSGYNQDINQVTPGIYRVTLAMDSATYYPVATGNTAGGGVWPYDWDNTAYTNGTSLTSAQALTLAQGNIRWAAILDSLDNLADCRIYDVTITAANGTTLNTDATNQPTAISFTVQFDRDAFILGEWTNWLKSQGSSANGTWSNPDFSVAQIAYNSLNSTSTAINTTVLALQDAITTAITKGRSSGYTRSYRVFSSTSGGGTQIPVTITQPNTPANIFGTVSVSQISGTTLAGSPL